MSKAKLRLLPTCRPAIPRVVLERAARRRFRALRVARFRTQLDAAVFLGVNDSTVERWESGASKVPGWALVAIEQPGWATSPQGEALGAVARKAAA